ncbi:hypothetical protein D3C86_1154670 [compost metagenome]
MRGRLAHGHALVFQAPMVDALGEACQLKVYVRQVGPCLAPYLQLLFRVPVPFLLSEPTTFNYARGHHRVEVGILAFKVMQVKLHDHTLVDQFALNEVTSQGKLLGPGELAR